MWGTAAVQIGRLALSGGARECSVTPEHTSREHEPVSTLRAACCNRGYDARVADQPFGYLITFRTYGSWLHGDPRGSVAFRRNDYGRPGVPPSETLRELKRSMMKGPEQALDARRRAEVLSAVEETCQHRGWDLHAVAVRTNHVHVLVTATDKPEKVLSSLKGWCTRRIREANLIEPDLKLWSHHGSTVYLWDDEQMQRAWLYVVEGQGAPLD